MHRHKLRHERDRRLSLWRKKWENIAHTAATVDYMIHKGADLRQGRDQEIYDQLSFHGHDSGHLATLWWRLHPDTVDRRRPHLRYR